MIFLGAAIGLAVGAVIGYDYGFRDALKAVGKTFEDLPKFDD